MLRYNRETAGLVHSPKEPITNTYETYESRAFVLDEEPEGRPYSPRRRGSVIDARNEGRENPVIFFDRDHDFYARGDEAVQDFRRIEKAEAALQGFRAVFLARSEAIKAKLDAEVQAFVARIGGER